MSVVDNLPETISTGIYYGWASVDRGPVYKMVMSIGWNPFYNNTKKSMVRAHCLCPEIKELKILMIDDIYIKIDDTYIFPFRRLI